MTFRHRTSRVAPLLLLTLAATLNAQTTTDAQITILQTTDLHHHANGADHVGLDVDPINATGLTGAYSRISAYVNFVRTNTSHPVVLVDSGDWTMGTLYDLTLGSRPLALLFLDLMKYDCVTLGNHEFDYAPQGLAQMLAAAQSTFAFRTPIVASNMNLGRSADLAPFVGAGKLIQNTRIQDLPNHLRVGYIGLMGHGAALDAPVSAPVSFTDFSSDYSTIQNLVDSLRNDQGVQVVIVLSHSGTDASGTSGEDVALATNVSGIDVIASGHTHTPLSSAHAVTNAGWTTQIIDAGAFGTNVSRIDLTYHAATNSTTLDASGNPPMTDGGLKAIDPALVADPAISAVVTAADQQLNIALGTFLKQTFPDYNPTSLSTGIYHPVGTAAQDMVYNGQDPVPSPNGLGDLAADAVRSVPNSILSQTLSAVGGNPANLPSYDFTPYQIGVVVTGVLRGKLLSGVQLSFADVYNVLPLGITPDTSQALPIGYPMISGYLELADVKTLCALQLVAQTNLTPSDDYLNFSGLKYGLKPAESYTYFKYATAAGVLQLANQSAVAGSLPALRSLVALLNLAKDSGASLLAAYGTDNPYAGAMVKLNDPNPTPAQLAANLAVLGQVAAAAAADPASGIATLLVSKAVAAIDTVSGFAPADAANIGSTVDFSSTSRIRLATDLFAILALDILKTQFGVTVTVFKSATGAAALSGADFAGILANRINANPAGSGLQELKEWMALLSYLETGLKGSISPAYASTSDFTQFPSTGPAVQTRNTSYPLVSIAQFTAALSTLAGAPPCASIGTPAVAAVTNSAYGVDLSASGTIIVWGTGFSPGGGNTIRLTQAGRTDPILLNTSTGAYFWDLSANQINATLPANLAPGPWSLSITNVCALTSPNFSITLR